jgi:hypothetical protein
MGGFLEIMRVVSLDGHASDLKRHDAARDT